MRDFFNKRQRFSLRKYSIGVCSVLLGTVLFAAHGVQAEEITGSETVSSSEVSVLDPLTLDAASSPQAADAVAEAGAAPEVQEPAANAAVLEAEGTAPDARVAEADTATSEATEAADSVPAAPASPEAASPVAEETQAQAAAAASEEGIIEEASPSPVERLGRAAVISPDATEVTSWDQFLAALRNADVSEIAINGSIVATGDNGNTDGTAANAVDRSVTINTQPHKVTIVGRDENAQLDFLSNTLVLSGAAWEIDFKNLKIASANSKGPINLSSTTGTNTVTFEDVTSTGSSLYGGGGNTNVIIKGETTSTVSDSYQAANGQTQFVQRNVGQAGTSNQRRQSNIHSASSVTVEDGASLTLNRSSQGDAITLPSGSVVNVQDNANLTINMNTNNINPANVAESSENTRYHNAGIFMADGGGVVTGQNSRLVLNTSVGQGISLGVNRPADGVTDADRFGGYGAENTNRKAGPSAVTIGDGAYFELNGRDGMIMGDNSQFTTGTRAIVRFENQGRGVAIDLGNDSLVSLGKNSNNTFHSVGKGPNPGSNAPLSGSYSGYNYIGLNEKGRILVDDYAVFRVQMDGRGDNDFDDVITLNTKTGSLDQPLFQANKGSIVDIRDDNTNFYAELISVPLGSSTNTVFQFNNPLYVSFMRYTKSDGITAGEVTGKLPINIPQGNNPVVDDRGNILYIANKNANSGNGIEFNGPVGTANSPVDGTYTVYSLSKDNANRQDISKQSSVWMNIDSGSFGIAGFQPNQTPDITADDLNSVETGSSPGGVSALDPAYGIDPALENRQNIWISNGTSINPTATHKHVIKYVYEDGTEVAPDVIQSSDWDRILEIGIDQDQFREILKNSPITNGDEFLRAYAQTDYGINDIDGDGIADTGWTVEGTNSNTYTYRTVTSPVLNGYRAEILRTNVPGLTSATSVSATVNGLTVTDPLLDNGSVSDAYWNNIIDTQDLGTYETVIVYRQVPQKATVRYINVNDPNNPITLESYDFEGASDTPIEHSATARIQYYVDRGYVLVDNPFPEGARFDSDASVVQSWDITLKHGTTPVGPDNPFDPTDPINPN
ncbi:pectate lyase-like adhesive domain-containing protein, partial [Streptococcus hyovaginalis]|uniref:pectate lyase-like adhesive domain-containing protein n=1 Tax=Streptococcus hyovaginalis TaxID=149015 RepID=UPI002A910DC4